MNLKEKTRQSVYKNSNYLELFHIKKWNDYDFLVYVYGLVQEKSSKLRLQNNMANLPFSGDDDFQSVQKRRQVSF